MRRGKKSIPKIFQVKIWNFLLPLNHLKKKKQKIFWKQCSLTLFLFNWIFQEKSLKILWIKENCSIITCLCIIREIGLKFLFILEKQKIQEKSILEEKKSFYIVLFSFKFWNLPSKRWQNCKNFSKENSEKFSEFLITSEDFLTCQLLKRVLLNIEY